MSNIEIEKITTLIKDRNGNVLVIEPDGSININIIDVIKCKILKAHDTNRTFTWNEIDGVRKVTKIIFSSASVNTELEQTIQLHRTFSYQASDPFDLTSVNDSLVIT